MNIDCNEPSNVLQMSKVMLFMPMYVLYVSPSRLAIVNFACINQSKLYEQITAVKNSGEFLSSENRTKTKCNKLQMF